MRDETDTTVSAFADAILDHHWNAAHALCARWVRDELAPTEIGSLVDVAREDRPWPATYRVSGNSFTTPDTLRDKWARQQVAAGRGAMAPTGAPVRRIPDDVTTDNHRRFVVLHFEPSDEDIAEHDVELSFVIRALVVADAGAIRIGWFDATN